MQWLSVVACASAAICVGACGAESSTNTIENVCTQELNDDGDAVINCHNNTNGPEPRIPSGSGSGGDGGIGAGGAGGGGSSDVEDVISDCAWKYNPAHAWEAYCIPNFKNKSALAAIRVRIDPADEKTMPVNKPVLGLIRFQAFTDQGEVVAQDEDASANAAAWSAEHWVEVTTHEIVDLDNYDYMIYFWPFEGDDCGPILETVFAYGF